MDCEREIDKTEISVYRKAFLDKSRETKFRLSHFIPSYFEILYQYTT
jgi:hypothetical protein